MNANRTIETTSIILLLFICQISFGQSVESDSVKNIRIKMICVPALSWKNQPLIIITSDNKRLQIPEDGNFRDSIARISSTNYINPEWVKSITVLRDKDATDKYGVLGENGAVLIELKKGSIKKFPRKTRNKFRDK